MKIVYVLGWYFPDSSGGSEVYVNGLAREMKALGHEVLIAAPHDGQGELSYEHEGIPVWRYPAGGGQSKAEASGEAPGNSIKIFGDWIVRQKPDLVHFHSWTRGVGYWHIRRVHEDGFTVYLTVHTASAFCARGTMWRWDRFPCDGEIRPFRCSACFLHSRLTAGMTFFLTVAVTSIPILQFLLVRAMLFHVHVALRWLGLLATGVAVAFPLVRWLVWGRLETLLKQPESLRRRRAQLREAWGMCRQVVSVCEWAGEALVRNGFPRERLVMCRQGANLHREEDVAVYQPHRPLRLGFLGRLDYVKGAMILVEAVRRLPKDCSVTLELKGIPQDSDYLQKLNSIVVRDSRIRLVKPSPPDEVRRWVRELDAMVVPSRWMETGPLVVYEAFLEKVPVIGAGHGGISELVQDKVNGLLFRPHDIDDLVRVLREVCRQPEILVRLRENIGKVRLMRDVAVDMDALYRGREE
jgi:glycosyltransferase involved in cell wall biosynthesis